MAYDYGSYPGNLVGGVKVNGATGAKIGKGIRVAATARAGKGVYTVTLADGGVDSTKALPEVTPINTVPIIAVVNQASDTVFNVLTFSQIDEVAATDSDFSFRVGRVET